MASTLPLPDLDSLATALSSLFHSDVRILARQRNRQTSTFPSEIVTCRLGEGQPLRVFCKYADPAFAHLHGHRSGVAFEARVYRDVLRHLELPSVHYHGEYIHPGTGATWLFLDALDELARVSKCPDPQAMPMAAAWIGRFHAAHAGKVGRLRYRLHVYDAAYFRHWAQRTIECAGSRLEELPWLRPLCDRLAEAPPEVLLRQDTVIHGEYYSANILLYQGRVCPVDWESAAASIGEIDLASLVEKWPADVAARCTEAYGAARWPAGVPATFPEALAAARMYLHLRWLGHRPWAGRRDDPGWRLPELKQLGEQRGWA